MKVRFIVEFEIDESSPNSKDNALHEMCDRLSQKFTSEWGIPAKRWAEIEETKVRKI